MEVPGGVLVGVVARRPLIKGPSASFSNDLDRLMLDVRARASVFYALQAR
jgi:hypothetical protein